MSDALDLVVQKNGSYVALGFGMMVHMLRTRDLMLFVLCLLFLVLAITITALRGHPTTELAPFALTDTSHMVTVPTSAATPPSTFDRQANLHALIDAIDATTPAVTPHPSVPNDVVVTPGYSTNNANATTTTTTSPSPIQLVACPYPDDAISRVPSWPIYNVALLTRADGRVVYTSSVGAATNASGTATTSTVTKILLRLPLVPQKTASPNCVPSTVIGVTTHGTLIFNNDVAAYRETGPDTLVGYARDGFPIYGTYSGTTDRCGGYDSPTGYHYTLSQDRDFILGCFVGTPQSFTL